MCLDQKDQGGLAALRKLHTRRVKWEQMHHCIGINAILISSSECRKFAHKNYVFHWDGFHQKKKKSFVIGWSTLHRVVKPGYVGPGKILLWWMKTSMEVILFKFLLLQLSCLYKCEAEKFLTLHPYFPMMLIRIPERQWKENCQTRKQWKHTLIKGRPGPLSGPATPQNWLQQSFKVQ